MTRRSRKPPFSTSPEVNPDHIDQIMAIRKHSPLNGETPHADRLRMAAVLHILTGETGLATGTVPWNALDRNEHGQILLREV